MILWCNFNYFIRKNYPGMWNGSSNVFYIRTEKHILIDKNSTPWSSVSTLQFFPFFYYTPNVSPLINASLYAYFYAVRYLACIEYVTDPPQGYFISTLDPPRRCLWQWPGAACIYIFNTGEFASAALAANRNFKIQSRPKGRALRRGSRGHSATTHQNKNRQRKREDSFYYVPGI